MSFRRFFLVCVLLGLRALADESPAAPPGASEPAHRPRVGLVLSGGGARGAAHIGVLKALEEMHVPVDVVVGTSMGAVVGGLYASGMSAREVEETLDSLDWQNALRDRPSRTSLNFRRKEDDREFLVHLPLGLRDGDLRVPRGLIQGQKLSARLRDATLPVADIERFDQLPIPFRAVAADLGTGETVVLDHGSLATAVRASFSLPGVFAPVPVEGRVLVDGGIVDNLPVDVARAMGVDLVIAVDVSTPLDEVEHLDSALAVSNQMIAILLNRGTSASRAQLRPEDVLIRPDLGRTSPLDFKNVRATARAGEVAAHALAERLRPLAVGEEEFRRFVARRAERPPAPRIDFVRVDPGSGRYHKLIEAELKPVIGKPADAATIDEGLQNLYGRDIFEAVDYRVVQDGALTGLDVSARPKSWGPTYLHFDLELQDDFQGNDSYSAGVRFLITDVNPYLAEWRIDLKIGDTPEARAEFFQPLGYASPWFVAPSAETGSRSVYVIDNGNTIASYRVRETDYGLDFGRELGDWGETRVGVRRIYGSSSLRIGTPNPGTALPPGSFNQGGYYGRFSVDLLDNVNFPRQGELVTLEWDSQRTALGANMDGDLARADWLIARSFGRNTFIFWTSAGTAVTAPQGVQSDFELGGFLNLSGIPANSIAGPHFGIARLIYMRKVGSGGEGFLDLPVYLGVSAEAGNVWQQRGDMSLASARKNGALFVGLDTPLGPLYLGSGFDESSHSTYYLFLGHTF
jgi:NTE family protein